MSSPRAKEKYIKQYTSIFKTIEKMGHKNVTDFILNVDEEKFYLSDISSFYKKTNKQLKNSDICIFDATIPSLAIGHLISTAIQFGKPVIIFYVGENPPHFLTGLNDNKVQLIHYEDHKLTNILSDALDYASSQQDTRFNFFVAPKHINFMDWIAHNKKIPRSVFLRRLIEREIANDDQYNNQ